MQPDPLLDAQIRGARYWNVDGLTEVAIGIQVLLVPACLYGIARTARGSAGRVTVVLALALGLPALMFLSGHLLTAVRRRFTYRRTGFVAYRRDRRPWAFGLALAGALVLLLLISRAANANWVMYLFVIQAVIPGALTVYLGRLLHLIRLQVLGAAYAIFGVAIALAGLDLTRGMMLFWSGVGAMYLLSGGITFWRYVRRHPAVAEAQ
jgi:hypothetical protein